MGSLARSRDGYFCGPARAFADDVRGELERRPVDVAVGELLTFSSMIGARGLGVPCAVVSTTVLALPGWGAPPFGPGLPPANGAAGRLRDRVVFALSDRMWDKGLPAINDARAANGLSPLRHTLEQMTDVDRLLLLTTRALEYPGFTPPENVLTTGARLGDPAWTEPLELPAGDDPLVLVGLSSTFMDQGRAIDRIAQALGTLPVRAIITTGPAIDPAAVAAPANVTVVQSAPHSEVLEHAAAMVTHAGHGSVVKALAAGVPLVMLPFGRDQNDVAARAAHAGAGVRLKPTASAAKIAAAVARRARPARLRPGRPACRDDDRARARTGRSSRRARSARRQPREHHARPARAGGDLRRAATHSARKAGAALRSPAPAAAHGDGGPGPTSATGRARAAGGPSPSSRRRARRPRPPDTTAAGPRAASGRSRPTASWRA